jgi:Glycosyl transferase family 2
MKLSVVVPFYNELRTLPTVVDRLLAVDVSAMGLETELILVDDGSTDAGRTLLDPLPRADVRVLVHDRNRGKGAAVRTGLEAATGDLLRKAWSSSRCRSPTGPAPTPRARRSTSGTGSWPPGRAGSRSAAGRVGGGVNVLERAEDDVAVLVVMAGAAAPGGRVLLLVPGDPALAGAYDAALGHSARRDDSASIAAAVARAGSAAHCRVGQWLARCDQSPLCASGILRPICRPRCEGLVA